MNTRSTMFSAGVLFSVGVNMAVQDLYGLEGYIVHLRADWIAMSPIWGALVALAALVYAAFNDLTQK